MKTATFRGGATIALIAAFASLSACQDAGPVAPPPGAATAVWHAPAPGQTTVRRTTSGASVMTATFTVLGDQSPYNGTPAYRVSDGSAVYVYARDTGNMIATLNADGSKQSETTPDNGTFSWPLFVGKTWKASFHYHDYQRQRDFNAVESYWKVEAYEDVTVPAGTFKAFRMQSSSGTGNAVKSTIWYSPDNTLTIKNIFERLPNHYLGEAVFTTELVSIGEPQK